MKMAFFGRRNPVLNIAFRYASCRLSPKHATSPVLAISTPSVTSAPDRRENENTGTYEKKQIIVCQFISNNIVCAVDFDFGIIFYFKELASF